MQGRVKFELEEKGTICSVKQILESIDKARQDHRCLTQIWYRGQSCSGWPLVPTIARKHSYGGKSVDGFSSSQEKNLLHRFRRRAYPHVGRILNEWEALFLARHHGLPTRLLDWTASPLFALYYACAENPGQSATVWGIARVPDEKHDLDMLALATQSDAGSGPFCHYGERCGQEDDQHTQDAVKILHPLDNSPRIVTQQGVFTFHSNPCIALDRYLGKCFWREQLDIKLLTRWEVRPYAKPIILKELHNLGISRRVVFPDLDGLGRGLWESEVLWHG